MCHLQSSLQNVDNYKRLCGYHKHPCVGCKYRQNVKDSEGKFGCRTPFSIVQITPTRAGRCENKTKKKNKEQATKTGETPLQSFFRASTEPAAGAPFAAEVLPANLPMVAEKQTKKVCQVSALR